MPNTPPIAVDNIAFRLESSLYQLYKALTGASYKSVYSQIPGVVKDIITTKLSDILQDARSFVQQFLAGDVLAQLLAVLDAGMSVANSTIDMLPEAVQAVAIKAQRVLAVIIDFAHAGAPHLNAVVDLVSATLLALPAPQIAPALASSTTQTLTDVGIITA